RLDVEDHPRGRRLATARFTDEAQGSAGFDRERDRIDRSHDAALAPEKAAPHRKVLGERLRLDERDHAGASSQHRLLRPAPSWSWGGASARQRSIACAQRGANAQPGGSAARSGGCPSIAVSHSVSAPSRGTEASRARVYGCRGAAKTASTGPASTMRPA